MGGSNRIAKTLPSQRRRSGWTLPELLAVILLAAVVLLIATLSIYRGKEAADELACQDNMRAIHSAVEIYWTKNRDSVTNEHIYPVDQAAFELFIGDRGSVGLYLAGSFYRCHLACKRWVVFQTD